ncbi:ribosomal protein [Tieghemiomyces parasiticus]|uniref:Ribosomal protein n=1 Tax=Tieghemiomyces parasiticus TaxID=78921 RepID=A0A9W8ACW4_9FUNG|nr:ribosomal protein [Tieghemiomyces parasiticus]
MQALRSISRRSLGALRAPVASTPVSAGYRAFSVTAHSDYRCRLREHYNHTLRDDIMTITYEHPNLTNPSASAVDSTPAVSPPPSPNAPKRPARNARPKRQPVPPSSPFNIYGLQSVTVHVRMKEALENKFNLLSGIMALQCMTGKRAEICYSRVDASSFKLRKGLPISVKVTLEGDDMYAFLDKLVEIVLPQIKEWRGLPRDAGDRNGNISFGFGPHVMGLFPDIENVYDMIPKIVGFHVNITTTAQRDPPARLVVSGFQIPFDQGNERV